MFKSNKIVYGYAIALGITFLGTSAGLLVGNNYHQDALQKMLGAAEDHKFLNTLQVDILYNRPAKQLSPYLADPDGFKREIGKFLDRIQKISTALEAYNSSGKTSNIEGLQPLLAEYEMAVKKFQQEAKLEIAQLTPLTESPKTLTAAELQLVRFVKNKDFVKFIEFPDRLLPFVQLADLQTTKAESALTYSKTIRNSIVAGSVLLSAVISGLFAIFASRAIAREQAAINQQLRDQLTEREQAEAQLSESEQRYVNLNAVAPVGIFRTDAEGNSIYINQHCCKMLGLPPEATTGKHWQQALHPDDREYVIAEQIRARRENLPFQLEYRILRPDGSVIWVLGNAVAEQEASGQIIGYVGTITDISDRKRSEEALQKNETHSRALISAMPDIIFRMNQEGVYLEFLAYPNFNVLGNLSEMVGTNVLDILPPQASQQRMKSVQQVIQTGSIQVYEQELCIDGITQIEEVRIVPYNETEVLGLVRDISDRKQSELALQNLIAGTAATTGQDFFPALVTHIAKALNVSHALVTELVDDELRSLAFWANGELQPTFSFNIVKTPCEKALQQGQFYCDSFVQQMFPQYLDLVKMEAYSYLGISLKDSNGKAIGNLSILDKKAIQNPQQAEKILQVFAARATAELERQRTNTMLVQLNQELESKVQKRTMELQKLSERLTLSLRSGAIGCWEWHIEPPHVIWDERMYELLGIKEKVDPRMVYQAWANGLHPEDRAATEVLAQQAILGEIEFDTEFRVVHPDRTIHFIKAYGTLLRDCEGKPQSLIGINFDISDRKQAENAVLESQKFLQRVLDTFPLSVFWKDRNSVYLGCNRNFLKDAGLESVADIIGKTDYDMPWNQTNADNYRAYDRQVIDNDEAKLGIIESQLSASGNQIWLETNKLPLYNLKGEVIGILGTYQDITERKQAEEQLQHTNQELIHATRLKDEFLANMSHELRTPLNAILGMTEGLQEQVYGSINDRQLKALQTVENSGNHLLELINDILNLAKIEAGQVELNYSSTSISYLCESSLNFIRQQAIKKQIHLDIHLQPNLPEMQLDERRIKQVLINILNNAVKFTPKGGRINLETKKLSYSSGQTPDQTQDYLQISITDTGIGISPENIQRIFKPFIQIDSALNRKYEGTGLGLALAKQIIELHSGTVGLTSELGIGSCFTIELPIKHLESNPVMESQSKSNLESNLEPSQTSRSASPLILLAEDNEANIITVTSYLEAKEYRLIIAMNGQEVIALAKSAHPDLILMDIQMPVMDGLEAIKQIRLDPKLVDIPIIALTALAMADDREKCIAAGANEYITKPIKLKALSQMIQTFLDS